MPKCDSELYKTEEVIFSEPECRVGNTFKMETSEEAEQGKSGGEKTEEEMVSHLKRTVSGGTLVGAASL